MNCSKHHLIPLQDNNNYSHDGGGFAGTPNDVRLFPHPHLQQQQQNPSASPSSSSYLIQQGMAWDPVHQHYYYRATPSSTSTNTRTTASSNTKITTSSNTTKSIPITPPQHQRRSLATLEAQQQEHLKAMAEYRDQVMFHRIYNSNKHPVSSTTTTTTTTLRTPPSVPSNLSSNTTKTRYNRPNMVNLHVQDVPPVLAKHAQFRDHYYYRHGVRYDIIPDDGAGDGAAAPSEEVFELDL